VTRAKARGTERASERDSNKTKQAKQAPRAEASGDLKPTSRRSASSERLKHDVTRAKARGTERASERDSNKTKQANRPRERRRAGAES